MATLQVKGIDDDLYRALGARARLENRSISQQVVMIIQEYLAHHPPRPHQAAAAFLELAGSWEDERSAREIAAEIRRARRTGGRAKRLGDVLD